MKTIIERGASWTLEETKLLLTLWGQDQVSRKDTPHKRTKEVYEKISEKFNQNGFERTPDQVRTRVFNMIAEYRRLLKDPNPERMKKCIFFDAMHKIYQAQHWSEVKSLIDDYEPETPFSPASNSKLSEMLGESISDSEAMDGQHYDTSSMDASNASNSVSNNNNNTSAAASKSAPNNDTTNSATTNTTTNNSNSGGGTNNKTSATSDNIANNSIIDNHSAKKNYSNKDGQLGAAAKRIKIESPKPGTSQGETNVESNTVSGDGKQSKSSSNNSNVAGPSSASNAPNASSTSSSSSSTNNSSSRGKQQSLLATSASSTTSTPITKLTPTGHSNGNESVNINGTQATTARLPTTAAITSHQLYQAPVNTFDVTSSALLIDRMFAHLSRESENMREWIALEKDRIALEKARRAQETEREIRRERVLIDTLMKFHEQWISFVARLDPRLVEGAAGQLPELNIPPKETDPQQQQGSSATSQINQISSASTTSALNPSSATSTVATSAPSCQLKGGGSSGSTAAPAASAASSSTAST